MERMRACVIIDMIGADKSTEKLIYVLVCEKVYTQGSGVGPLTHIHC